MLYKFQDFTLNENLNQARACLRRQNIPETNPNFVKLRELLTRNPGYLGKFTKWMFEDKYTFDRLSELYKRLQGSNIDINTVKTPEDVIDTIVSNNTATAFNQIIMSIPSRVRDELKDSYGWKDIERVIRGNLDKKDKFISFFSRKGGTLGEKEDDEIVEILKRLCDNQNEKLLQDCRKTLLLETKEWIIFYVIDHDDCRKFGSPYWCIVEDEDTYNDYTFENNSLQLIGYSKEKELFVDDESVIGMTVNIVATRRSDRDENGLPTHCVKIEAAHWEDDNDAIRTATQLVKSISATSVEKILYSDEYLSNETAMENLNMDKISILFKNGSLSFDKCIDLLFSGDRYGDRERMDQLNTNHLKILLSNSEDIKKFLRKYSKDLSDDQYVSDIINTYISKNIGVEYIDYLPTMTLLEKFIDGKESDIDTIKSSLIKKRELDHDFDIFMEDQQIAQKNVIRYMQLLDCLGSNIRQNTKNDWFSYVIDNYYDNISELDFKFNKSILTKVRELSKGYKDARLSYKGEFIVNGSVNGLSTSLKIRLYRTGEIDNLDIQVFDTDLFKSAIELNDDEMVQKLVNLLPGKDKYTITATKKEDVEDKAVRKVPTKAATKKAPTKAATKKVVKKK